jgi:hypothetical protein
VLCSTCVGISIFEPSVVYFLKLLAEPELRYRYSTRVAEWEVGVLGVVEGCEDACFFFAVFLFMRLAMYLISGTGGAQVCAGYGRMEIVQQHLR